MIECGGNHMARNEIHRLQTERKKLQKEAKHVESLHKKVRDLGRKRDELTSEYLAAFKELYLRNENLLAKEKNLRDLLAKEKNLRTQVIRLFKVQKA